LFYSEWFQNGVNIMQFVIQADTHIDNMTNTNVLHRTIENILSVNPSFVMDLGDTLMLERYGLTESGLKNRLEQLSSYFSLFNKIPICLVNGNHDGETGFRPRLLCQSQIVRNEICPMPFQDTSSFSGNVKTANYYAFQKEDVLFIALDPFTFTQRPGGGWNDTLGIVQYQWLERLLNHSSETFKFVFIHHLTGGINREHRGGIAAAELFEWGGKELNGQNTFSENRPNMTMPVHDLLVKYGVTAVFHGHDHFYAREELDGIQYILVSQPGTSRPKVVTSVEKGYTTGVILPSAGFLNVMISGGEASISYCKTSQADKYAIADSTVLVGKN